VLVGSLRLRLVRVLGAIDLGDTLSFS